MAAAVADFRPRDPADGKLKKTGLDDLTIELEATTDVLSGLAASRRNTQLVVGFAAEHGDGALAYGREKLVRKRLDAIVVNDIGAAGVGFDAIDNEVTVITATDETSVPKASKPEVARAILEIVGGLHTRLRLPAP